MTTFNDYVALGKYTLDRRTDSSRYNINKWSISFFMTVCHSNLKCIFQLEIWNMRQFVFEVLVMPTHNQHRMLTTADYSVLVPYHMFVKGRCANWPWQLTKQYEYDWFAFLRVFSPICQRYFPSLTSGKMEAIATLKSQWKKEGKSVCSFIKMVTPPQCQTV
jgi:hypothetical protein